MATTEALRTQLDTLRLEKQKLEVENARLREAQPEEAERINSEEEASRWQTEAVRFQSESESHATEAAHLQQLYDQLLRDMQGMQEELERFQVLQRQEEQHAAKIAELTEEVARQTAKAEKEESNCEQLRVEMLRTNERIELECFSQTTNCNIRARLVITPHIQTTTCNRLLLSHLFPIITTCLICYMMH